MHDFVCTHSGARSVGKLLGSEYFLCPSCEETFRGIERNVRDYLNIRMTGFLDAIADLELGVRGMKATLRRDRRP